MNKEEMRHRQQEEILMTLDQVSQTLEVMATVIHRLKVQVCSQMENAPTQESLDLALPAQKNRMH